MVRVPRLAIAVIAGVVLAWLGALLALGPLLAWVGSGPVLLPGRAGEVCQQCLSAANPFPGAGEPVLVPSILLLALPAALALLLGTAVVRGLYVRSARTRAAAAALQRNATPARLHGLNVAVVAGGEPFALTFPSRHGGIVVSSAALELLSADELAAVLAHEHAHLRQRHHLVSAVVEGVAAHLRWVPLIRAAADALPHYLEIAADAHAARSAGTPALVSALVKLGERSAAGLPQGLGPVALHAAGPERIRQLVQPGTGMAGALPAAAITGYLGILVIIAAAVYLPYTSAALTGC